MNISLLHRLLSCSSLHAKNCPRQYLYQTSFFQLVQLFNAMSYAGIIHTLCNPHYLIQFVISTVISYDSSRHNEGWGSVFCHIMPASFLEIMFFCFLYLICRIFTKKVKFSANFLYESVCRFPLHG